MKRAPLCTTAALLAALLALPFALSLPGAPAPVRPAKGFANSIDMKLVLVPAGKFQMGAPAGEGGRGAEGPVHEVELTQSFYLGAYEVTQGQFQKVMGTNPSWFSPTGVGKGQVAGLDATALPVENLTWEEASTFCRKLSALPAETRAGRAYRLPTEAEWEHACRAGTTTTFGLGATLGVNEANFGNRVRRPEKVGSYKPNAWGLYDMHGNVWEYCADHYEDGYYAKSPKKDPKGPIAGGPVVRGGGWEVEARSCRSATRSYASQARYYAIGFRAACTTSRAR